MTAVRTASPSVTATMIGESRKIANDFADQYLGRSAGSEIRRNPARQYMVIQAFGRIT